MVGLGVVLEEQQPHKKRSNINISKVINKTTMMLSTINNKTSSPLSYHSPFKVSTFLDQCFLCSKKLLPGKDIYMYKGDRAFCSVDCRCKHILADEEEAMKKQNIFEE